MINDVNDVYSWLILPINFFSINFFYHYLLRAMDVHSAEIEFLVDNAVDDDGD